MRQFVTEAIEEKLKPTSEAKPWIQVAGKLRHLKKENALINRIIDKEFGQIEPEDWK